MDKDIWQDDLLGRRQEARFLANFLAHKYNTMSRTGEDEAYTIAIDGGFGEGKSFFLRRLQKELARNHPVAFIDAWADDTADQPLTALMCAIEEAVEPYLKRTGPIKKLWNKVQDERWTLAKIAALGLAKRGAGLLITKTGVDELESTLTGKDKSTDEARENAESVEEALDRIADVYAKKQVNSFIERRNSIKQFKENMSKLILNLNINDDGNNIHIQPPIFIIVDELDRCRPTYAVKLLEEVKHLFAIRGIIFIFGTHLEALTHSVRSLYGLEYPAELYMKRFIKRVYKLKEVSLVGLVQDRIDRGRFSKSSLIIPEVIEDRNESISSLAFIIDRVMRRNAMRARDLDSVIDFIENFARLWGKDIPIHAAPLVLETVHKLLPVGSRFDVPTVKLYSKNHGEFSLSELWSDYKNLNHRANQPVEVRGRDSALHRYMADLINTEIQLRANRPDLASEFGDQLSYQTYKERLAVLGRVHLLEADDLRTSTTKD